MNATIAGIINDKIVRKHLWPFLVPFGTLTTKLVTETPAPEGNLLPDQQEKLRELTTQSWNLELVISGAALFAILQLPDLFDVLFDYLHFNLLSQTEGMQALLPMMAYSMMKATCYVLFMAFLTNFVMRAFWVGLVGLLAVYPTGIHYDRIPFTTTYAQERMAAKLGALDSYILRLDRRCNIVFAVAFLIVFILIIVALSYLLTILVHSILRPLIPIQYWQGVKLAVQLLFAGYMLASIVLSLPKVRAHPSGADLNYRFSTLSKFLYFGLHTPFVFILNTFYSHLPYQKILRMVGLLIGVFFFLIMVEFTADFSRLDRRTGGIINRRHLFTARVDSLYINPSSYDNQRSEGQYIDVASIQADVISDRYVRLYIAYPKALDTLLTRMAPEPARNETLPIAERRRQFAEWSNRQVNQLMHISVNDSLYRSPGLLFTQRDYPQQRGWQTVLLPTNLRVGRNTLQIAVQADSSARKEKIVTIPFWYVPEK